MIQLDQLCDEVWVIFNNNVNGQHVRGPEVSGAKCLRVRADSYYVVVDYVPNKENYKNPLKTIVYNRDKIQEFCTEGSLLCLLSQNKQ